MSAKNVPHIEEFNSDLKSVLGELEESQYLIIVADQKKAFLFLYNKGFIELSKTIMDPGIRKETKINSGELFGKNTKLSHKVDNEIHRHLQLIMQEVELLIRGKHINGVLFGGHKPLFHVMEKELPANLKEKLRGEFVTELNIPEEELIAHCKHALDEYLK